MPDRHLCFMYFEHCTFARWSRDVSGRSSGVAGEEWAEDVGARLVLFVRDRLQRVVVVACGASSYTRTTP